MTAIVDARPRAAGPPDPGVVAEVAAVLRAGRVVVLPTDTVYGLAASPTVAGATDRVFAAKGRTAEVPLAVLCSAPDQALALADPAAVSDRVRRLARRLWPGPLTLVLPRRPDLAYALGEPATTVGVRCPDHPLLRAVAAAVGPIATTSANHHGEPTPEGAAEVAALFGDEVALVVDGGRCAGAPSTVVDATGPTLTPLRLGPLSLAEVERAAAP